MTRSPDRQLPAPLAAPQDKGGRDRLDTRVGDGSNPPKAAHPYAAQMLGQGGQKRGLRGGAPVLDAARSAYLGAEYSGEHDRRPPRGLLVKTAI